MKRTLVTIVLALAVVGLLIGSFWLGANQDKWLTSQGKELLSGSSGGKEFKMPELKQAIATTPEGWTRFEKMSTERIKEAQQLEIQEKAERIIWWTKGKNDGKCKKNGLKISVSTIHDWGGFRVYEIIIVYEGREVFRYQSDDPKSGEVVVYRPGEWLMKFDTIYKEVKENDIRRKIANLKERFAIE